MKTCVVYESLWGNTAAIARAIAEGLGPGARAISTAEATPEALAGAGLVVAGSPRFAFRLPTDAIRETTAQVNQNGSTVRASMANMEAIARVNASGAAEISAASEEQTASVEEMAASTHALTDLAVSLRQVVLQFKY